MERFQTFAGLGTPANTVITLDQMRGQWTYGLQGTAYQGRGYAAVPHQRSNFDVEIHVEDDKAREGRHG